MAALQFFFSFEGRLARGRFWIFGLILYALATLALAFDPVMTEALQTLLWLPASTALLLYLFLGMWGFSIAVLTMAVDLLIMRGGAGAQGAVLPFIVSAALSVLLGWIIIAVSSKRLHDRGKSGWWLVIFIVAPFALIEVGFSLGGDAAHAFCALAALALHLWSFVEMGCRRGVRGRNAYGPDPLARMAG